MEEFQVFLRETIFGKEFLNIINNKTFRMRVVERPLFSYEYYLKIFKSIETLNEFGIVLPKKIDSKKEYYHLFFEYWNETPIEEINITEKIFFNILYRVYDIVDRVTHSTNIVIPYLSLEDIFMDEMGNVYIIPPIFSYVKENEKIFINNKRNEDGVIDVLIQFTEYLFNRIENKTENIHKCYNKLKNRKFECVHDLYELLLMYSEFSKTKPELIREPHFIDRVEERNKILNFVGKKHIFIYGPQRIGKTRLIQFLEFKFKEMNYEIIKARSIKDIYSKKINVPESMNIFYFLNLVETLRKNNKNFKMVIIIDDYQDIDIQFKNFIEELINKSFDFPFSIIMISHFEPKYKFNNIEYINLKPFDKGNTKILLKIILSADFLEKYPEFIDIVYELSEGYPGNIYQIIKDLHALKIIEFKEQRFIFYPEKLKNKKLIDLSNEKIKSIQESILKDLIYLSSLGFRFDNNDIKNLERFLKRSLDSSILYAIENNIIIRENEEFRFFNYSYLDILHNKLNEYDKRLIHEYLCKSTNDLKKKIYHLKISGKIRSTIALIIKEMKKSLNEWSNLDFIDYGFNEIKNMTTDIPKSAIAIYLTKKFILNEYSKEIEVYKEKLIKSSVYNYLPYLFLKYSNKNGLNKKLLHWIKDKEKITDYKKGLYIYYFLNTNFTDLSKEEVFEYYYEFEKVYSKYKNLRKFKILKGMMLNMLGIKMERELPELSLKYYNDAIKISLEENYRRLTQIIYTNMAILYESLNSSLSEYYNNKVLGISKEIGDYRTYNRVLINIANSKLYKGEIIEFFDLINKAERYSKINNDYNSYILANDLKNYYYLYAKDYSNLNSNIRKIKNYIKDKPLLGKTVEDLNNSIYVLKALFDKNNSIFKEKKYIKILSNNEFFSNMYNLVFENDEEKLYKSWLFFKNNPLVYFKEEIVNIVSDKIARYSFNEEYEKWVMDLINEFKDKKLSLALLYEGLGNFYDIKMEKFKSLKHLRKAQRIYDSLMMKNRFEEINKTLIEKFHLPLFSFKDVYSENYERTRLDYEMLYSKIKSYEKINDLIFDLLKSESPKSLVDKIGEYLRNTYPVNKVFIRVITNDFEVEYNFNFSEEEKIEIDEFLLEPLELSYISDYKDYKYYMYISNSDIILSHMEAVNLLDNLIILEDILHSMFDKITHYEQSIMDPLTLAYTRRYMENKLSELIGLYERYKFEFSIIILDLDDFKKVNDTYGHQKGDVVLTELVNSLKKHLREFDIVCRYGGEEFLVILPNTDIKDAEKIAFRLLKEINKDLFEKTELNITCSMGLASISQLKDIKIETLINYADKALYLAKNKGKNRIEIARGD